MSRNPKVTIALAFTLTFLFGVGTGYLLRGEVPFPISERETLSQEVTRRGGQSADAFRDNRGGNNEQRPGWGRESRYDREGNLRAYDDRSVTGRNRVDEESDTATRRYQERNADNPDSRRHSYRRIREQLKVDLNLSDESAEKFFGILAQHREQVKVEIVDPHREISAQYKELGEQLENDLAEVLTMEQMEIWQERYAPRMQHYQRSKMNEN